MLVLLRHAHREPIVNGPEGHKARLTELGRKKAEEAGKKLKTFCGKEVLFLSSWVPRCVETAMHMAIGFGPKKVKAIHIDRQGVLRTLWKEGKENEVLESITGGQFWKKMQEWREKGLAGALPISEVVERCERLIKRVAEMYGAEDMVVITHDTTLAAFAFYYHIEPFTARRIGFLEGFVKSAKGWRGISLL